MTTLNKTLPLDSDYVGNGAGELRDIKAYILDMVEPMIPPVGSIISYLPGYFADGSNGTFTEVSLTLEDNYEICDGSAVNDSDSSIFNGASRYLPNLTDDRFLMGDTAYGNLGDGTTTLIEANLPSHAHTFSGTSSNNNVSHTHSVSGNTATQGGQETTAAGGHYHYTVDYDTTSNTTIGLGQYLSYKNGDSAGDNSYELNGLSSSSLGAGRSSTENDHTHSSGDHLHSFAVTSGGESTVHTHTYSGTTSSVGSATAFNNIPKYLSCKYIMRIK